MGPHVHAQDLFAMNAVLWNADVKEEQINVPAIRHHYWRYRIPVLLEDLSSPTYDTFTGELHSLLKDSGRVT